MPSKYYTQKKEKEYGHIDRIDRLKIEIGLNWRKSVNEIAIRIGKHRSTIYRELNRNREFQTPYISHVAHKNYRKKLKEAQNRTLVLTIIEYLLALLYITITATFKLLI